MTSSHICVWTRKEFGSDSAAASDRRRPWIERAVLLDLDPFDGIAKYMSWHFTEHLSALGSRQHVSWTFSLGLSAWSAASAQFILSVLLSPALVS